MVNPRRQRAKIALLPLPPHAHPKTCEQFGALNTPEEQREIAELAFSLWLARGFRRGSPQEDWIQALRQRADGGETA